MVSKQHVNPDTMAKPTGYSHVVKAGNTVYIAGQICQAQDGTVMGKGDAEAQTRQIWKNIEAAVKSVGGDLGSVVKTTTYVTSIAHAAGVRKVREELFKAGNPPTSTLVVVSELANPDYIVEIEGIAVV